MGTVARFDLASLRAKYDLHYFVETGTGQGDGLAHAASINPGFFSLASCEIEPTLAEAAKARFAGEGRIAVMNASSATFLARMCALLPPDEPALFFLDAHFPGADYGLRGYGAEKADALRLPLEDELRLIARNRPAGKDVVIIDDLRIYIDGPFQHGNLPVNVRPMCPKARNVHFVKAVMGATHTVELLYDHEGYILLLPCEDEGHG